MADTQTNVLTRRATRSVVNKSVKALLDPLVGKFNLLTALGSRVVSEACYNFFEQLLQDADDAQIVQLLERGSDLMDHAACKALAYVPLVAQHKQLLVGMYEFSHVFGQCRWPGTMQSSASMELLNDNNQLEY